MNNSDFEAKLNSRKKRRIKKTKMKFKESETSSKRFIGSSWGRYII